MKIYLACALTHVPEKDFSNYTCMLQRIACELKKQHQVKYALVDSDPQLAEKPPRDKPKLCYLWDKKMVEDADVVIAEASFPSIGLGIEMEIAKEKKIPLIICFEQAESKRSHDKYYENPDNTHHQLQIGEGYISLMALGLPNLFSVVPYLEEEKCIIELQKLLNVLNKKISNT